MYFHFGVLFNKGTIVVLVLPAGTVIIVVEDVRLWQLSLVTVVCGCCVCVCVFSAVSFYNTLIQPGYSCVQIVACVFSVVSFHDTSIHTAVCGCVCVCVLFLVLFHFRIKPGYCCVQTLICMCVCVCVHFLIVLFSAVSFSVCIFI